MKKVNDKNTNKINWEQWLESEIPSPQPKGIEDTQSLIEIISKYSADMGIQKTFPVGISIIKDKTSLEDFCNSIWLYINTNINKYNNVNSTEIPRSRFSSTLNVDFNYSDRIKWLTKVLNDYFNELHKDKKIYQEDKFRDSVMSIHFLCAMLIAKNLILLQKILKEDSKEFPDTWKLTYEIGLLQGEMCLIESHLDPDIIEIQHKRKASEAKNEGLEESNKKRDLLYKGPLEYAEKKWKTEKKLIYHNKMAEDIMKEFSELKLNQRILLEKLRPIAKNIRYSDFSEGEFEDQPAITILCNVISNDNYRIKVNLPENTIGWLNEIIKTPDFYSKWFKRKGETDLSPELDELIRDTLSCHKKKFSELTEEEQRKVKRLNRLLLEHTYPRITPPSRKNGSMRGWTGEDNKDRC